MKWLFFFVSFFLFLPFVSAEMYDSYHVEAELVAEEVYAQVEVRGNFSQENVFSLPPNVQDLQVFLDGDGISCSASEEVGRTFVDCPVSEGPHEVLLLFHTSYPFVRLDTENILFQWDQDVAAQDFLFTLKLEEGFVVKDKTLIVPVLDQVYSDGRRTVLVWKEGPYSGQFLSSVLIGTPGHSSWIFYVSAFAFLVLLAAFLYYRKEKTVFISGALLENEKKVIAVLKEHNNQIWQKQLEIQTGLPKVKLSRLLASLERRGMVQKEPYGASNIIRLLDRKEE